MNVTGRAPHGHPETLAGRHVEIVHQFVHPETISPDSVYTHTGDGETFVIQSLLS